MLFLPLLAIRRAVLMKRICANGGTNLAKLCVPKGLVGWMKMGRILYHGGARQRFVFLFANRLG